MNDYIEMLREKEKTIRSLNQILQEQSEKILALKRLLRKKTGWGEQKLELEMTMEMNREMGR
jgi:hypothetical protein